MKIREIFEARTQVKRKYGEHASIRVNEKTPVRNKVIEFVGKRFVTEEEMKNFLTKLTEERGKDLNQKQWFGRNQRFFESFENRGQKVWTLSKYGKRVLEMITKSAQKQTINESVGLFKKEIFESVSINEGVSINNLSDYQFGQSGNGNFSLETPEEQEAIMKFLNVRSMDELYSFGGEVEFDSEQGGDEENRLYDDYIDGPAGEFNNFAFFELRRICMTSKDKLPDALETSGMGHIIEGAKKGVAYCGNDYGMQYAYTNKKTVLELLKQFNAQ